MNNLIATCGTSIITNSFTTKEEFLNGRNYSELTSEELLSLEKTLYNKLQEFDSDDRILGAEINSISMLLKKNKDKFSGEKIYLLVSDSPEGVVAGNLIKKFLMEKLSIQKVEIEKISLLNITKEFEFAKKGLKNLCLRVAYIIGQHNVGDIAVAPIGGFKAQIFIVGLVAQIYKAKAYYLYEGSENIIELPPLPITLDSSILTRNIEIVSELKKEEILEKKYVDDYIKKDPELKTFLEEEHIDGKNYFSLSVLGSLAYDKLELELKSFLPAPSGKKSTEKRYTTKSGESHCEQVTETPEFKKFISSLLAVPFVEEIIVNYYFQDSKGTQIFFNKSSNKTEGRILGFSYNHKKGMVEGNIFLTESDDENKVNSALLYLKENIYS